MSVEGVIGGGVSEKEVSSTTCSVREEEVLRV